MDNLEHVPLEEAKPHGKLCSIELPPGGTRISCDAGQIIVRSPRMLVAGRGVGVDRKIQEIEANVDTILDMPANEAFELAAADGCAVFVEFVGNVGLFAVVDAPSAEASATE